MKDNYNPKYSTAIPNDLMDKYMPLFKGKGQMEAVLDLIRQTYKFGYEKGAEEEYDRILKE